MFIVIEGLDGIGKTTTAEHLAAKLKGEFFPWLHSPYEQALPCIWENDLVSEASKHLAFLATFRHMSDIVASPSYQDKTMVTDRYYFCSFAMHEPLARITGEKALNLKNIPLGFKRPDFAFYLALGEKQRRERLASRSKPLTPVEILLSENAAFRAQVTQNYEAMATAGEMKKIDIDDLSTEQIVEEIVLKSGFKAG